MPNEINGLPAHILLVHAVVILVPLAALLGVLGVVWPASRRRLGIATPILALVALLFVPVTSHAGEWLRDHVPDSELVRRHAELGDGLLMPAGVLFLLITALWYLDRIGPDRSASDGSTTDGSGGVLTGRAARAVVSVALVLVAVFAVVQTYRIGDSGAKAAWNGRVSSTSTGAGGD